MIDYQVFSSGTDLRVSRIIVEPCKTKRRPSARRDEGRPPEGYCLAERGRYKSPVEMKVVRLH